jgi:NAD(P)-dependent dehydrogenase (short-subunit alcohol dehydrogenase family)
LYQYIDNNKAMNKIALITGATRNLGFSLAEGLAQRLEPTDTVYLTGRDTARVAESALRLSNARAEVRGEVLDVAQPEAVERFADLLAGRHGGIDIVFSNHYTRVQPDDDPRAVIDYYVEANNLGTTHVLRSIAPLLRDGGRLFVVASRAGSLRALAPALHPRFENLQSLDDVDRAVCRWRDAVRSGRAPGQAWPAWINIPSKIGQVAAVRVLAGQRRADDLRRGILIASISPGLIDTGASRAWLDLTGAPQPDEVAGPLLDLALDPAPDESFYGELIHVGRGEPGPFGSVVPSGSIVPWK